MTRSFRATIWTGALGALVLVPPAAAGTLAFEYQVDWGYITLAEASVSLTELGERYTLLGKGRTEGIIGLLFDWQGMARTEGIASNDERWPLLHSNEGIRDGAKMATHVDWSEAGTPRTETDPPPDLEEVTRVPETSIDGTSDPFTALMTVLDTLNEKRRCEGKAKVWDGRRRYDLVVEHGGTDDLVADRPWAYAGPTIKCSLSIERIGGFWRETSSSRMILAADIAGGRYVPVRAEFETGFGTIVGRLRPPGAEDQPEVALEEEVDRR
jgi:hypothetical protein